MSKPVKYMILSDYQQRFTGIDGALVIDVRGVDANDNNALRLGLRKKNIRVTIVRNTLARKAFAGTNLEAIAPALSGPAALAYGADSVVDVAREIIDQAKKIANLQFKGAVLDGEFYEGEAGVKRLSEFPTKDEAIAKVVQLVLSPAGNLVRAATSPGSNVLGIVKEIQERLEKGEAIGKVA